jgi:hypothetical protein
MALTVQTDAANNIISNSAALNGTLIDDNSDTPVSCYFEYGEDTGYGGETTPQDVDMGPFFTVLTGLASGTTYHYRTVAVGSSLDTVYGADELFVTSAETVAVYKSIDSMQTWQIVKSITGSTTGIVEIDGSELDSNKVAFGEDANIWVTLDGGNTWRIAYTHPNGSFIKGLMVREDEIQAVFDAAPANPIMVRSPNFGSTWYDGTNENSGTVDIAFDRFNPTSNGIIAGGSSLQNISIPDNYPDYVSVTTISGAATVTVLDADRETALALIGTTSGLYKTLDWGENIALLLDVPVTDVAIGGSFVMTTGLIDVLRPTADVTLGLTGNLTGAHYALIDEYTLNDSDYVYATAGPVYDLYTKNNMLATTVSGINFVSLHFIYDAPNGYVKGGFKIGGTEYWGIENTASGWVEGSESWSTSPAGGSWTVETVNAMSVGLKLQSSSGQTKVAQMWMEVGYDL